MAEEGYTKEGEDARVKVTWSSRKRVRAQRRRLGNLASKVTSRQPDVRGGSEKDLEAMVAN